jgi:hypothetical protein
VPGYNHFDWCTCGWCYKTGRNGYSAKAIVRQFDQSYPRRILKERGADRSWVACFVNPNASCPVCFAKVYYYENAHGSRVFFDDLGWPWPKHHCTDRRRPPAPLAGQGGPINRRTRGEVGEILEAAQAAQFDPNAGFRERFGRPPLDLLIVMQVARRGFENLVKAESLSPALDEPIFLSFTSAKFHPQVGDYFSHGDGEVFFVSADLTPRNFKSRLIQPEDFASHDIQEPR